MEDIGGTVGEPSYADVLQGTVKVDSKQIFLKEADIFVAAKITKEQWLTNVELYKSLGAEIPVDAIFGIQRAGSLWRLCIENISNRIGGVNKGYEYTTLRKKPIYRTEKTSYG